MYYWWPSLKVLHRFPLAWLSIPHWSLNCQPLESIIQKPSWHFCFPSLSVLSFIFKEVKNFAAENNDCSDIDFWARPGAVVLLNWTLDENEDENRSNFVCPWVADTFGFEALNIFSQSQWNEIVQLIVQLLWPVYPHICESGVSTRLADWNSKGNCWATWSDPYLWLVAFWSGGRHWSLVPWPYCRRSFWE